MVRTFYAIMESEGEAQEKVSKKLAEHLSTLENGIQKDLGIEGPFIHGEKPGLLDVIMGSGPGGFRVFADLVGIDLLDKKKVPFLHSCLASYMDLEGHYCSP